MAQKVIVPQKKIISRIFLNSGTLIVKLSPAREGLVSDIPARDGKTVNLFLQCVIFGRKYTCVCATVELVPLLAVHRSGPH